MELENHEITNKKKSWIAPTITTLIGVGVSILIGWYQISLSEEQAQEAEKERSKSVKSELVQIVEEHVINQDQLDISRISRLAEFKAREERLLVAPTVSEIVQSAEFNIIKSQYLEHDKKQKFKEIFNKIYAEIHKPENIQYNGISASSVNDILSSINEGNNKEASAKIIKLATDFSTRIEDLESKEKLKEGKSLPDILRILLDKPELFISACLGYIVLLYAVMIFRRKMKTDRMMREREMEFLDEFRKKTEFKRQQQNSRFADQESPAA